MGEYDFKLTPAYCLYNGAAVVEQRGSYIRILVDNNNELVKERLKRAFTNHVNYVLGHKDCPPDFSGLPVVEFVSGNRNQLRKCVSELYETKNENSAVFKYAGTKTDGSNGQKMEKLIDDAAAVLLLDTIILEARDKNATDIHIEEKAVKLRINGKLEEYCTLSDEHCEELIQRIKVLGQMNVLEKRKSQDGHFVYGNSEPVFVRVSCVGVVGKGHEGTGESVVLRLLDTHRLPLNLENLGFSVKQHGILEQLCLEKNGIVITCGPTGSGKSTTNAAMLMEIQKKNYGRVKIISLEDPPEYVMEGITQVYIDENNGRGFDEALKYVFRQDPDVIMIGEIRDENTAQTALRAALTGHLVFATVHSSSAEAVISRMVDLGVNEKVFRSVLRGVISQKLNYVEKRVNLLADVSVYDCHAGEFSHCDNYSQVVSKSIKNMYLDRFGSGTEKLEGEVKGA